MMAEYKVNGPETSLSREPRVVVVGGVEPGDGVLDLVAQLGALREQGVRVWSVTYSTDRYEGISSQ